MSRELGHLTPLWFGAPERLNTFARRVPSVPEFQARVFAESV
jgi:hypothetical protein